MNRFYVMRQSLYFWDAESKGWKATDSDRVLGGLTTQQVQRLAELMTCASQDQVFSSLMGMQAPPGTLEELRKALKTVCKFVGPLARQVWRLKAGANVPRQCKSACMMGCESFAIGGRCEHACTALLAEKEIQLDTDWVKPDAAKGRRLWPRGYEPQLDAEEAAAAGGSAERMVPQAQPGSPVTPSSAQVPLGTSPARIWSERDMRREIRSCDFFEECRSNRNVRPRAAVQE